MNPKAGSDVADPAVETEVADGSHVHDFCAARAGGVLDGPGGCRHWGLRGRSCGDFALSLNRDPSVPAWF